jgi:hypothetical protein
LTLGQSDKQRIFNAQALKKQYFHGLKICFCVCERENPFKIASKYIYIATLHNKTESILHYLEGIVSVGAG